MSRLTRALFSDDKEHATPRMWTSTETVLILEREPPEASSKVPTDEDQAFTKLGSSNHSLLESSTSLTCA